MKQKPIYVDYHYENTLNQSLKLWISLPKGDYLSSLKPNHLHKLPTGDNLGYFVLPNHTALNLRYHQEWYTPEHRTTPLTKEEEAYYLRDTTLSPINDEIVELAKTITNGIEKKNDQAKAIFQYIVTNFKYIYPPKSRGVKSFLRLRKGDCGEFSFLFSSLCRSLGIPTRTLFGCWSIGKMSGHAWNEIYLEDEGWIAVDVSMANIQKYQVFKLFTSDIRTLRWKNYFGKTEGQRVVFSKDAEFELLPAFVESEEISTEIEPLSINDEPFYWGQESLNGKAPYLQPAYVKFSPGKFPPHTSIGAEHLLGSWRAKEKGWRGIVAHSKKYFVGIGLFAMGLDVIFHNDFLDLVFKCSFVGLFLCFILRRERLVLFSIALLFMALSLAASFSELL
ncbi:transglutaminase-like domain-containing protein [Oceanobacillus kapialis]|uniref:transglutaminase-like domain-containing protein n=1 Tax=Oceanobacillus kapialis TaxID=481353 RepID=UPI00384ED6D9